MCCGGGFGGGGGGGGGNLLGTLTAPFIPYASAAHTLADSSLQYNNGTDVLSTTADLHIGADIVMDAGLGQITCEFLDVNSNANIDGLLAVGAAGINVGSGNFIVDGSNGDTTIAGLLTQNGLSNFNKRTLLVPVPITAAPAITLDSADGNQFSIIGIDQNMAINAPLNPVDGATMLLELSGNASTPWTLTWNAVFSFGTGGAPVPDLSGAYTALSYLGFRYSAWNTKWNYLGTLVGPFT
jgi:hypothetical protein